MSTPPTTDRPSAAADPKVEQATKQLESGDGSGLRDLLKGDSEVQRVGLLNDVRRLYTADQTATPSLPNLTIQTYAFTGSDVESVKLGNKFVYQSSLDITNLTRTESVNGQPFSQPESVVGAQPKVDVPTLAHLYEDGKGDQAAALMTGLSEEERIQALGAAASYNHKNDYGKTTEAYLEFNSGMSKNGPNEISLVRNTPDWGPFSHGVELFSERYDPETNSLTINTKNDDTLAAKPKSTST